MFYCFRDDVIFEKGKGTKTFQGEIVGWLCKKWNFLTQSEEESSAELVCFAGKKKNYLLNCPTRVLMARRLKKPTKHNNNKKKSMFSYKYLYIHLFSKLPFRLCIQTSKKIHRGKSQEILTSIRTKVQWSKWKGKREKEWAQWAALEMFTHWTWLKRVIIFVSPFPIMAFHSPEPMRT